MDADLDLQEISVVIPAFNEARRIRASIEAVAAYLAPRFPRHEVLVVDDGSSDATTAEVEAAALPSVRVLRNPANSGKGFSVRRGILEARFDPILFTDADLSTPIEELEKLLEPLRRGYHAAIGSRHMPGSAVERSLPRRFLSWGFSRLTAAMVVKGFKDTQCGFKVFRREAAREVFRRQTIDRWGFDVEVLAIAARLGLRVAEVPVRWRQSGDSRIRLRTPLEMAEELLRIRRNAERGLYDPEPGKPPGPT